MQSSQVAGLYGYTDLVMLNRGGLALVWLRALKSDDFFIQLAGIAGQVLNVVQQPRIAWSCNVELRPFCDSW